MLDCEIQLSLPTRCLPTPRPPRTRRANAMLCDYLTLPFGSGFSVDNMVVGGVAVRVSVEALSSGSLSLKRSTAEQFFHLESLQNRAILCSNDPVPLLLYPFASKCNSRAVAVQLLPLDRTACPSQAHGAAAPLPPPPSLYCELFGLGGWMRGQGAVPGVHWVQLWRGAGGALMLRLCDGKPTGVPGEEARGQQQQQQQIKQQQTQSNALVRLAASAPLVAASLAGRQRIQQRLQAPWMHLVVQRWQRHRPPACWSGRQRRTWQMQRQGGSCTCAHAQR